MSKTKQRGLTRCRNRKASGPTIYAMTIGGLTLLIPHRAFLLDTTLSQAQQMARDYRERHRL